MPFRQRITAPTVIGKNIGSCLFSKSPNLSGQTSLPFSCPTPTPLLAYTPIRTDHQNTKRSFCQNRTEKKFTTGQTTFLNGIFMAGRRSTHLRGCSPRSPIRSLLADLPPHTLSPAFALLSLCPLFAGHLCPPPPLTPATRA